MQLSAAKAESTDQAAYLEACAATSQLALFHLCAHPCHFVRSRAVSKMLKPAHMPEKIIDDPHPAVVLNLILNAYCADVFAPHVAKRAIREVQESPGDKFNDVAFWWQSVWPMLAKHPQVDFADRLEIEKYIFLANPNVHKPPIQHYTTEERVILTNLNENAKGKYPEHDRITPGGWLAYANHWSRKVRCALLKRSDCPKEIAEFLTKDRNWIVWFFAKRKLFYWPA